MACLVYVNPEGIDADTLNNIKSQVMNGLPSDDGINNDTIHMEETSLHYPDLLAKARAIESLDANCFYVLDKDSSDKGAVLCVEAKLYTDVKGMSYRLPSSATTRRFYLRPEFASAMAVNLSIANMGWEDFDSDFGHAHLKRGEVSKPWQDS